MNRYEVQSRLESALSALRQVDEMQSDLGVRLCVADTRKNLEAIFAGLFADWVEQNQPASTN